MNTQGICLSYLSDWVWAVFLPIKSFLSLSFFFIRIILSLQTLTAHFPVYYAQQLLFKKFDYSSFSKCFPTVKILN